MIHADSILRSFSKLIVVDVDVPKFRSLNKELVVDQTNRLLVVAPQLNEWIVELDAQLAEQSLYEWCFLGGLREGEKLRCGGGCGDNILLIGSPSDHSDKELHHVALATLSVHGVVGGACVAPDFEGIVIPKAEP
jgi:hypothetical protein